MSYRGLLYLSKAKAPFSEEALNSLLDKSYQNNLVLSVTGYLYYKDGQFVQYIEGDSDKLKTLFKHISIDPRHKILKAVDLEMINKRLFPTWSMKKLDDSMLQYLSLEQLLLDQLNILSELRDGPNFASSCFELVNKLASAQERIG